MISKRTAIALASCVFGLGMILWGSRMGSEAPEGNAASSEAASPAKPKKSKPAWNVALGDVVVFAPELGFHVKALKDEAPDTTRLAAHIEAQLGELRNRYRQAAEAHPGLMGGILLQLNVGPGGEVTNVRDIGSRIPDSEFKKSMIEAASKWNFSELIASPVVITCPLVLVREGMDITTVI
ncbi:MAG TPA: AgmX/PglI C-terminal domain-containing protein, partial [Candidatus Eisenbacteria bacterium]|nr:AgmX/PglI C-terminal domain-containing protein [Candidatus Eisenbacteria bacterium]